MILKNLSLVKIDVTKNNKNDIGLLKYLNVMGPPAYIFFDGEGNEINGYRNTRIYGTKEISRTFRRARYILIKLYFRGILMKIEEN